MWRAELTPVVKQLASHDTDLEIVSVTRHNVHCKDETDNAADITTDRHTLTGGT